MDNVFQTAALSLIDDHIEWLKTDEALKHKKVIGNNFHYAHEFRTLKLGCRRQIGHTTLVNSLAFNVADDIGCKYSTFIISPTYDMARYNYRPDNIYFDPRTCVDELKQSLAHDYALEIYNFEKLNSNYSGKVFPASSLRTGHGSTRIFLDRHRDAIKTLTGKEVDRFDLCLIDGASRLSERQIDDIYAHFGGDVELFVFLQ